VSFVGENLAREIEVMMSVKKCLRDGSSTT
jgi:hypothetical protein